MSLQFKRNTPRNYSNLKVLFEDTSQTSPKFFRVSDVPQVLTKGKNLLRISAHPSNLVPNSQIIVDIKDANGDPIYFEVPDYLEQDKSRVISIWIYHDKDDDNTANGDATITIYGISRVDQNGKQVPSRYRGKHNVKWSTTINVDRDRENISPVIFKGDTLPTISISESIEAYQNLPSTGTELELTTQTGGGARYIYKGRTPIVQLTDGSEFNQEMVEYSLQLGNFETSATPETKFENPTNITSYTSSILRILDNTTAVLQNPFTTTFDDREDLTHTFTSIESADYSISYFETSSNIVTENQRSYANLTINNVNPISGYPNKLRVLIKSDGLPGDYELLNEVTVPFSSSLSVKIPIPSEHLEDPKRIKIQYLNSIGEISRTETITTPYNFQGGNTYIGGKKNLISGSMFISNTLDSGIELGGISSGFIRSVGFEGQTSASLGKGPGGFIIYSGSGNLQVGEDVLNGVGLQLIGDNDDRHLIFTTAEGGLLDVKTDKFFIGTTGTQFISGSNGNIEISSSLFHLDPQNNLLVIGADAVINADLTVNNLRTPALINGVQSTRANSSSSIDSDGFARFVSASIGGFEVSETQINSANDNLILKDSGQITGSNVLFSGGEIAGFEITNTQINSTNNNIILKASGQLTASDGFLFGNKDTSQYVQYSDGNLVVRGNLSVDQIFTPAIINGSPANITNASSSITSDGFAKFVSASIGGWDISTGSIEGGNLIMKPEGILQTRDFATGVKGWKISSEGNGTAEFENVRIRGTMRTTTFEKESVNAVGGQLWVANSTTITGSVIANDATMSVKNAKGFESGEILIAKKVDGTGFQTEYILVNSSSVDGNQSNEDENYGRIYVTRGYGSGSSGDFVGDIASISQSYEDGQVVVSTGKIGTGYIKLNANPSDTATPFIDVVERTGSGLYDVTLAARLGDLSGLANSDYVFGNPNPGYGLATDNVFLQGGIRANTGSIGGINMDSGKLFTGVGTWGNSNTGFYVDSESSMSLSNTFKWDGSELNISGSQISLLTPNFFFGGETQFISGANSNIEISSSNFHLKNNGDVVIGGGATIEQGAVFGVLPSLPSNEKLKVYIPFEEGAGTKVFNHATEEYPATISGNYTRVSGSNTAYGNSIFFKGGYLTFDGNPSGRLLIHEDVSAVSQSLNVWLNTPSASISTPQVVYEQNGTSNGQALIIKENIVYWYMYTTSGASKNIVSCSISDNELTCIGTIIDEGEDVIRIYKNGILQQEEYSILNFGGAGAVGIGAGNGITIITGSGDTGTQYGTTGDLPYYGMMDELRIYKEALTSANFLALYQNPGGVSSTTKITGDNISTGQIKSNNLSTTQGTLIDLNGEVLKIGGTSVTPTSGEGIVLDGSVTGQPKFFVGDATSAFIRFGETAGALEVSSSNFHLSEAGDVTLSGTVTAEAGRIASFQITSSKFDALRTVEVFTPKNNLTASFGDGASIPTEVDNRATITITNVTESNISITERVDNTRVYLDTPSYSVNEPYQINYSGSFNFNSGQVTFVSESLNISFPTASFGAITGGFFQMDNFESGEFTVFNDGTEGNYLESVNGLYAFAIEVPAGGTPSFASTVNKSSINTFNGYIYSPAGFSLDDRVGFWSVNGDDLELFVKPDLRMISSLTGSSTSIVVSSSDSKDYIQHWDVAGSPPQFQLFDNWDAGSFVGGLSGVTNSQNPTEDFINAYWTASAGPYSPDPQYIWINSGSVEDLREGDPLTGNIIYYFFLTASNSNVLDQPDISLFAPHITATVTSGQQITPTQYNTISSSFFAYDEGIARQFGFESEDQLLVYFGEGDVGFFPPSSYAPVRGVSEGRVSWNETRYSSGTPSTGVNYTTSTYHALYLQPGWFINPSVVSILNGIDTNTSIVDANNPNTWLEIGISGSTYIGVSGLKRTQPGHGVPLTLYNNNVRTQYTPSTEVKLYNSIWPLDIAESGSFQPNDGTGFGDGVISLIGSAVNITNRLDATRVQTNLTLSQLASLTGSGDPYEGVANNNTQQGPRYDHSVTYESTKQYSVGTVSTGFLSGSFVDKVTFRISGSGEVSSSNFFLDEFGNITGSQVNFSGGIISGSNLTINANQFEFKTQNGRVFGDSNNFIISSSLLSLDNNSLEVKGDLRASSGYIQDTYLGGKIVETGVINPSVAGIRYSLPFLEVWTTSSTDNRLGIDGDDSSQTLVGSHGNWVIGGPIQTIKQYLVTGSALDGVSYPDEFKSWYDISGISNDYKFIDNFNVLNVSDASASISPSIIGTQLVFNSASFKPTGSAVVSTVTSEFINISESLNNNYRNTHLQFAARGTTHPYSGGFTGFAPQYRVDIVSGSKTFFTKRYKDENATEKNWVVFDIPITDILTIDANATTDSRVEKEFKVKISMNYSGSSATGTLGSGVNGIGFALTEMRLVEPVRIASIDTQTIHFKDTYITWDGKEVTAHKGHFAPIITSSAFESISGSEYSLGRPSQRWRTAYLKDSVSTLSDRRLKSNIQISDLGLNFIDSLKPVKYNMGDEKTHYGLIAQEVSQSLAEFNVEKFGGYDTDGQYLALRYEEFISPLIKAVQEQSQIIMELQRRVETLECGSNN